MSKLKFTPIDFAGSTGNNFHVSWDDAAAIANARLAEMLVSAKVVYGWFNGDGACRFSELKVIGSDKGEATHRALLINIEEIKREPCEHEPMRSCGGPKAFYSENECKHCGVKLKAKWEESK